MITSLGTCLVFLAGYMAASIEWQPFLSAVFNVHINHYGRLLLCCLLIPVLFALLIVWPICVVHKNLEARFVQEGKPVKRVSLRKVMERRGSWPLAYKNVVITEDF